MIPWDHLVKSNFNPRTHEECDLAFTRADKKGAISIHALTRSATSTF